MKHKILIIEDDEILSDTLSDFFNSNGLEVIQAENGKKGEQLFRNIKPDVILLDVMLPDCTGFDVILAIRKLDNNVPVIFMTGTEFDTNSQVRGYENGAVNYIAKPVNPPVLLAQINRLLTQESSRIFSCGNIRIIITDQLVNIAGKDIYLREKEAQLLNLLFEDINKTISRKQIMETLWKEQNYKRSAQLDVAISRIKKALREFTYIEIVSFYGQGYQLQIKKDLSEL